MKLTNKNVIMRWSVGEPAENGRGTLWTDGANLYSYELRIGYTTAGGTKIVMLYCRPWNYISKTTSAHVRLALRLIAPPYVCNPASGEIRRFTYERAYAGTMCGSVYLALVLVYPGKSFNAVLNACVEAGIVARVEYDCGFIAKELWVPSSVAKALRLLADMRLKWAEVKKVLHGVARGYWPEELAVAQSLDVLKRI